MRILVIGGNGMLGHQLLSSLSETSDHEVRVTLRQPLHCYDSVGRFGPRNAYGGVDVRDLDSLRLALDDFGPNAVVNAAGIVKQRPEVAAESAERLAVNGTFPHQLASLAQPYGARVVQISTDCVFSGRKGNYSEADFPDPVDLYGRSKLQGELVGPSHCVTLRTSIVGWELGSRQGLFEWALGQSGVIRGYRRAIYSGLTTLELARVIELILTSYPLMHGVWHVGSASISKHELLTGLVARTGRTDLEVRPDDTVVCDRSLSSSAFRRATGYISPAWDAMLDEVVSQLRALELTGARR